MQIYDVTLFMCKDAKHQSVDLIQNNVHRPTIIPEDKIICK